MSRGKHAVPREWHAPALRCSGKLHPIEPETPHDPPTPPHPTPPGLAADPPGPRLRRAAAFGRSGDRTGPAEARAGERDELRARGLAGAGGAGRDGETRDGDS